MLNFFRNELFLWKPNRYNTNMARNNSIKTVYLLDEGRTGGCQLVYDVSTHFGATRTISTPLKVRIYCKSASYTYLVLPLRTNFKFVNLRILNCSSFYSSSFEDNIFYFYARNRFSSTILDIVVII